MVKQERILRIVRILFIVYAASLFWILHILKPSVTTPPAPVLYESITALAVADGLIGILVQRLMLKAKARPLLNGKMRTPAQRWFSANVIRLAFATSTSLFGFELHMLSAPERLAQILVGLGILYMLMPLGKPPAEPAESALGSIKQG
jgi:hypothetical protein